MDKIQQRYNENQKQIEFHGQVTDRFTYDDMRRLGHEFIKAGDFTARGLRRFITSKRLDPEASALFTRFVANFSKDNGMWSKLADPDAYQLGGEGTRFIEASNASGKRVLINLGNQ